jgi:hypothetical protein
MFASLLVIIQVFKDFVTYMDSGRLLRSWTLPSVDDGGMKVKYVSE